jgi:hypothetical protein
MTGLDDARPLKPAYGSPCNGCGLCCEAQQCPLSEMLLGEHDLCPALTPLGNVYVCGLVADTWRFFHSSGKDEADSALRSAIAYLLGAGIGCDANLLGEEISPEGAARVRAASDLDKGRKAATVLISFLPLLRQSPLRGHVVRKEGERT